MNLKNVKDAYETINVMVDKVQKDNEKIIEVKQAINNVAECCDIKGSHKAQHLITNYKNNMNNIVKLSTQMSREIIMSASETVKTYQKFIEDLNDNHEYKLAAICLEMVENKVTQEEICNKFEISRSTLNRKINELNSRFDDFSENVA